MLVEPSAVPLGCVWPESVLVDDKSLVVDAPGPKPVDDGSDEVSGEVFVGAGPEVELEVTEWLWSPGEELVGDEGPGAATMGS